MSQPSADIVTACRIMVDVTVGEGVRISPFVNLYGCSIEAESRIGPFVEVQSGVRIGRRCKVGSHSFICSGVTVEDDVFIGHGVVFTNDRYPRATAPDGRPKGPSDWQMESTLVCRGASIGSGAVILPGTRIGSDATIGAGAVVTRDVPDACAVAGVPARTLAASRRTSPDHDDDRDRRQLADAGSSHPLS